MDIVIPEGMTDAAMLALIIGFVSPLVLNFIVKATWPSWAKSLSAFAWAVVLGVATIAVTGAWNGMSVVTTILLILVVSITTYQNFWRNVAPDMQRGSAEKAAIEEHKAVVVQEKIAREVAEQVVDEHGIGGDQLSGGASA